MRLSWNSSLRRTTQCLAGFHHHYRARGRVVTLRTYASTRELSVDEINDRIFQTQGRRAEYASRRVACPGCTSHNFSPVTLLKHMLTCCPDLVDNTEVCSFQNSCISIPTHPCRGVPGGRNRLGSTSNSCGIV